MRYNNTSATTCATMHREEKNGTTTTTLNGTVETATAKDEYITHPRPERTNYNQGGRLKFFKDGKFILELERAREGERVSWVSVPRKTFWPPQSTPTSTPTYRQESSTSLSVSDDNSSIQSSPWQRDHSWKQTTPQRNLSKALCFYYRRSKHPNVPNSSHLLNLNSHRKCHYRRPYHDITIKLDSSGSTDNSTAAPVNPKAENMAMADGKVNAKGETVLARRYRGKFRCMGLLAIVQSLVERIGINPSVSSVVANGVSSLGAIRTPPRQDVIVSPRKRFLREMDRDNKVALDDNCQKRSRSKQNTTATNNHNTSIASSSSTNSIINPTSVVTTATSAIPVTTTTQPLNINGTTSATSPAPTTTTSAISLLATAPTATAVVSGSSTGASATQRSSSSYSITSLLADDRPSSGSSGGSNRGGRKASPIANVASVITNTTSSHPSYLGFGAGHIMSSVEERLYTENVDRLRSIELSHADKRAAATALSYNPIHSVPTLPPPGPVLHPSYAAYLPYHHHPALYHPHHYPTAAAPSPLYYAALYASQQQQSINSSTRPAPYPHHHHQSPYILPTLHPPPLSAVTVGGSRGHSLLTSLHQHHHSNSGSSIWTTPGSSVGLRQSGVTLPPPNIAQTQPADLSRLPLGVHHHLATLASPSVAVGSAIHNDTLPDMPLNLSKNAG